MRAVALLVAAGEGRRLGAGRPKALVPCAGRPLLLWSLDALVAAPSVGRVVVALPGGSGSELLPRGVVAVSGGRERVDSVAAALAAAGDGDLVLVHDGARPLLTVEIAERTLAAAAVEGVDGAIAAAPIADTVKRVTGDGRTVAGTVDRSGLWAAQTPQVFRREALERALLLGRTDPAAATDEASLVERGGGRVVVVDPEAPNLKVTTAADLAHAELLLLARG